MITSSRSIIHRLLTPRVPLPPRHSPFAAPLRLGVSLSLSFGIAALLIFLLETAGPSYAQPAGKGLASVITVTTSIQAAIDAASDGDTVFVPAGLYTESLTLNKPVSLIGDNANTTVIHALANQRVLTVTGATITPSTVISGLMFTGGSLVSSKCPGACGGGLLITGTASPLLSDLIISRNVAYLGGGIYAASGSLFSMSESQVISNSVNVGDGAGAYGGGLYALSAVNINGSRFERNWAYSGGGIHASSLAITDTDFIDNAASSAGGGVYVYPGTIAVLRGRFQGNSGCAIFALASNMVLADANVISNTGAACGGAMAATITVTNSHFEGNTQSGSSGLVCPNCPVAGALGADGILSVTNTTFVRNTSNANGGAIFSYGNLYLKDSIFLENVSVGAYGGAIYTWANATTIIGGRFEGNSAYGNGGAFYSLEGILYLTGTEFISNTSLRYSAGGGMFSGGSSVLVNPVFVSNTAPEGGGLFAYGPVTITGGTFERNSAPYGGGVYIYSTASISDSNFVNNIANVGRDLYSGDGIGNSSYGGNVLVVNSLFHGSSTTTTASAIYLGLGTYGKSITGTILHSTIAAPALNTAPAIELVSGTLGITDTIIASYTVGVSASGGGKVYEDYNLFFQTFTPVSGTVVSGWHSRSGDPAFVSPTTNDYHLTVGSAAIDSGTNAGIGDDLDGNPRPVGPGYDIGAYEYQAIVNRTYLPLIR